MSFLNKLDGPIWSNLIAAGIIAVLTIIASLALPGAWNPNYVTAIAIIGAVLVAGIVMRIWRRPKTIVFVSSGGTCRDPMAKAITVKLFETEKPKHPVVVRAAGMGPISGDKASFGARSAIKEMYGQDLLEHHRPELLTQKLLDEADLVLVMSEDLLDPAKIQCKLSGWPKAYEDAGKLYLFKKFFGEAGNVSDPYPDGKDQETLARYQDCANELHKILTENFDRLLKILHV